MKPRSAPDRTDQAADEIALREHEDGQGGKHGQRGVGEDLRVSVLYCDWNMATASGSVKCDGVLSTMSGSR